MPEVPNTSPKHKLSRTLVRSSPSFQAPSKVTPLNTLHAVDTTLVLACVMDMCHHPTPAQRRPHSRRCLSAWETGPCAGTSRASRPLQQHSFLKGDSVQSTCRRPCCCRPWCSCRHSAGHTLSSAQRPWELCRDPLPPGWEKQRAWVSWGGVGSGQSEVQSGCPGSAIHKCPPAVRPTVGRSACHGGGEGPLQGWI